MEIACLDLEGVLIPEVWINVAERTGIEELRATTRDIPDYDVLMRQRLRILDENGLGLPEIQEVIATMEPLEGALEMLTDPITGSPAHGKTVEGIVTIHVDDAFLSGTKFFHKKVIDALRRDFQVGSEDLNDIMFVGQRVRWVNRGKPSQK